jgi:hypothetical protein
MGHENFEQRENVTGSSNRSFGFVFAGVFAAIWAYLFFFGRGGPLWLLVVGGMFLLLALIAPALLGPLNQVWTRFGLLLHQIVSPVVLGIMFFLVVTPIGLLMRGLGKDLLRLKLDADSKSYWIERTPPGPTPESLKHLF